jgi:hypothetical protein
MTIDQKWPHMASRRVPPHSRPPLLVVEHRPLSSPNLPKVAICSGRQDGQNRGMILGIGEYLNKCWRRGRAPPEFVHLAPQAGGIAVFAAARELLRVRFIPYVKCVEVVPWLGIGQSLDGRIVFRAGKLYPRSRPRK